LLRELGVSAAVGVGAAPAAGDVEEFQVPDVFWQGRVDDQVLTDGVEAEQGAQE
jgi:hypothetical protein